MYFKGCSDINNSFLPVSQATQRIKTSYNNINFQTVSRLSFHVNTNLNLSIVNVEVYAEFRFKGAP